MTAFTEFTVESTALAWRETLGWTAKPGVEVALGELAAEHRDFGRFVLMQRLWQH